MFNKLTLKNFMIFKKAEFQFGNLNIIIGENGSGKTQFLKLLFALGKISASNIRIRLTGQKAFIDYRNNEGHPEDELNGFLKGVFNVEQTNDLIHFDVNCKKTVSEIGTFLCAKGDTSAFHISIEPGKGDSSSWDSSGLTILSRESDKKYSPDVFADVLSFQSREILSIYKGYRSLHDKYYLPYDSSVTDTISKLGVPYLKDTPKEYQKIIEKLESQIKGKIYLDNEQFYYRPDGMPGDGKHAWKIDMAAEGWRKLGMLLQVLKNGELNSGMTLLWDEPEANLNPKLICLIAKVIVELTKLNIQVFVTTHSLFFLREIDMLTKADKSLLKGDVRYFNFVGKGEVEQGEIPEDLGNILLLDESLAQSERFLKMED